MSIPRIFAPLGLALTCFCVSFFLSPPAHAAHGYALWGDLKYPQGFSHFDYVNPQAPKGGTARMIAFGTFDNFNRVVAGVKGNAKRSLLCALGSSIATLMPALSLVLYFLWASG